VSPAKGASFDFNVPEGPFEITLDFGRPSETLFGIRVYSGEKHWTEIGFDQNKKEFYMDRTQSGMEVAREFRGRTKAPLVTGRRYDLKVVVDRSSIEAYAQGGTIAMTNLIFPVSRGNRVVLFPTDTKRQAVGEIRKLASIWK